MPFGLIKLYSGGIPTLMDLKMLRYFVTAVEERSIQRAASRMNMAQPALSRRLRDLEAELGCTLLERGTRGVKPTQEGVTLYRKALAILDDVETTCRDMRRMGQEHARAPRLGLIQTSRKYGFLQTALAAFRAELPNAGIAFEWGMSADLGASLAEGRLDMTLIYGGRHGSQHVNERLIHREKIILAVHPAHRLAGHGPIDLAQLTGEPLIWLSRRDNADGHDETLQQCRLHGLEPLIAHTYLTSRTHAPYEAETKLGFEAVQRPKIQHACRHRQHGRGWHQAYACSHDGQVYLLDMTTDCARFDIRTRARRI